MADDTPDTADTPVSIRASKNGPYLVKGPISLRDDHGNEHDVSGKKTVALCRCGGSTTKPFCDGTHSRIGFQAAEQAVKREAEAEANADADEDDTGA